MTQQPVGTSHDAIVLPDSLNARNMENLNYPNLD